MKNTSKLLALLLCIVMVFAIVPLTAFAEETVVKNIFDDKGNGVTIASWGVESDTVIDKAFKKEGEASLKISYKPDTNQGTSAFYFNGNYNITEEVRETGVLQFWYYSETSFPQVTLALTAPFGDGSKSCENRVALIDKYVFASDTGKWTLVQIPLTEFKKGQYWNGTGFEDVDFDFSKVATMLVLGKTTGVTDVKPLYLDEIKIVTGAEIAEKEEPAGTEYYVSPKGSDGNSGLTPDKPLKTPQVAVNKTRPGDTVYFMEGQFTSNKGGILNIKTSGEEGKYITFTNYKDEKPVFKAGGDVWDCITVTASYIILDGLTLVGIADEVTVEEGFDSYYAVLNKQDTGEDYDNAAVARTNTNGININGRPATAAGITQPHHITVRNCDVSMFPGGGINVLDADWITIENNRSYNNMWYSLWGSSGISVNGSVDVDDNYTDYKTIIRNNLVYGNMCKVMCQNGRKWSDGNGIIIDYTKNTGHADKAPYKGKTLIENNLVYENGGGGIHLFNSNNIDVVNNTCVDNGKTPELTHWGNLSVSWCTNVKLLNNIAVATRDNTTTMTYGDKNTEIYYINNIHYSYANPEKTQSNFGSGQIKDEFDYNNIWTDPKFVSVDNHDYHLTAQSPAVDTGAVTMAPAIDYADDKRPQGAAIDMGAYESTYTSANPKKDLVIDFDAYKPAEEVITVDLVQCAKGRPTVDGIKDDLWDNTELFTAQKFYKGTTGATGTIRTLWDENYIYVWAEVKDTTPNDSNKDAWYQDSIEFFIDENNANTPEYELDDAQYRISYKGLITGGTNADIDKFVAKAVIVDGGYHVEAAIPFKSHKPSENTKVGFDIQINDDPGTGISESTVRWSDGENKTHADTRKFGDLLLVDSYMHLESNDASVVKISIDGKTLEGLDVDPFIYEARTLVPLRAIFEALGATVEWEEATETVTGTKDGKVVKLQIGNTKASANGKDITLDVPAMLKNDRTMVPVRFISESLGCKVEWVAARNLVLITTK